MARPQSDSLSAEQLAARIDAEGRLAVRVTPGARKAQILIAEDDVRVKVRARAQDGKANEAAIALIAAALGIAPSRIALASGRTSRSKIFEIGA